VSALARRFDAIRKTLFLDDSRLHSLYVELITGLVAHGYCIKLRHEGGLSDTSSRILYVVGCAILLDEDYSIYT